MATEGIERLHYFPRQFLSAEDFKVEQTYHCDMRRRHNTGYRTQGIATGLELVELELAGDDAGADVFVQPGMAVDSAGREIVILHPYKLESFLFDAFANAPLQHYGVWATYQEEGANCPRTGYKSYGVPNPYKRVRETFRILVAKSLPPADAAASGVAVRLGSVHWDGQNQKLLASAPGRLLEQRRYIGVIAEEIVAPAGKLLVRTRQRPNASPSEASGVAVTLEGALQVNRELTARQDAHVQGGLRIGPSASGTPLTIHGSTADEELIHFTDANGAPTWHLKQNLGGNNPGLHVAETNVADGRLFIKAGGHVGMGTTTPTHALHIAGDDPALALDIRSQSPNDRAELRFTVDDAVQSTIAWSKSEQKTYITHQGATVLTIDRGNIGIGTPSPTQTLDVRGAIRLHDGNLSAPGGVENLRIIRGTIQANGTIAAGSGFTATLVETGTYVITFDAAFPSQPSGSVTQIIPDPDDAAAAETAPATQPNLCAKIMRWLCGPPAAPLPLTEQAIISRIDPTHVNVITGNSRGARSNRDFTFIIMGPR